MDVHGDVVDAHHLAAVDIDDLLIEQVAADAQHVLVVMVGEELLVAELNAPSREMERIWSKRTVSQVSAAAHQEAVDAGRMLEGHQSGVFDSADAPALEVETGMDSSSVK